MQQLEIAFETYAHQHVSVRRATLAPIRSSAHPLWSALILFHLSTPHHTNEKIGNRWGGTRGGGESDAGRAKWLESPNVVVRIGQSCPNRNAVDIPTSGLPRNPCTFSDNARVSRQARDWNFHRVSILTVQTPAIDHCRGPHPIFTSAALNLCCW